jgi:hypothetical protein
MERGGGVLLNVKYFGYICRLKIMAAFGTLIGCLMGWELV